MIGQLVSDKLANLLLGGVDVLQEYHFTM